MSDPSSIQFYVKENLKPKGITEVIGLVEDVVLATFVSTGVHGFVVSHIPCLLRSEPGGLVLCSHVAAANPHAELIRSGAPSVAVFKRESGYISSSWYGDAPDRDSAPTWNFEVVHCHGVPHAVDETAALSHLVDLVAKMEKGRTVPWTIGELGERGIARRLKAIVAFEMPVGRLEGKFKLGQDEKRNDTARAVEHLMTTGNASLAERMKLYSLQNQYKAQSD